MERLRYLVVLADLDYRGSQRVAQNYAVGMHQLGHRVQVLTVSAKGPRAEQLESLGIPCYCINADPTAMAEATQFKPQVVHVHRPGLYDPILTPLLQRFRSSLNPIILETNFFSRVDYRLPAGVVDVHLQLSKWCLWKWSRWSQKLSYQPTGAVLPYSVIADDFFRSTQTEIDACKQSIGIPKDDFVFGRIGANSEAKWHPIIVDGFRVVAEQRPDVSLLLVAPPPSIQKRVEALPVAIRQKVIVQPAVYCDKELSLLYSSMDVMLHASRIGESFGMVLVESLLCETPVITLSTPAKDNSQVEVVEHQRSGRVVNNAHQFIAAMLDFVNNRESVADLGRYGRKRVLDLYANDVICSQLSELCHCMLQVCTVRPVCHTRVLDVLAHLGLEVQVASNYATTTLREFDGSVPWDEAVLTRLVHNAYVYRAYSSGLLSLKSRLMLR